MSVDGRHRIQSQFWTLGYAPRPTVHANAEQLSELKRWNISPNSLVNYRLLKPPGGDCFLGDEVEFRIRPRDHLHRCAPGEDSPNRSTELLSEVCGSGGTGTPRRSIRGGSIYQLGLHLGARSKRECGSPSFGPPGSGARTSASISANLSSARAYSLCLKRSSRRNFGHCICFPSRTHAGPQPVVPPPSRRFPWRSLISLGMGHA